MRSYPRRLIALLLLVNSIAFSLAAPFLPEKIAALDQAVAEAIAAKKIPGGVLWCEHDGQAYQRAYGLRAYRCGLCKGWHLTSDPGREDEAVS